MDRLKRKEPEIRIESLVFFCFIKLLCNVLIKQKTFCEDVTLRNTVTVRSDSEIMKISSIIIDMKGRFRKI